MFTPLAAPLLAAFTLMPHPAPEPPGPWIVKEPAWYVVDDSTTEELTSPDKPGHKNTKSSHATYTVQLTPEMYDPLIKRFTFCIYAMSLEMPTPMGVVKFDSAAPPPPKDDPMSGSFHAALSRIIKVPLTIDLGGGKITFIKGNEKLTEKSDSLGKLRDLYFSDRAISETFGYCLTHGLEPELKEGATVIIAEPTIVSKFISLVAPTKYTVTQIRDDVATITLAPAEGAMIKSVDDKMVRDAVGDITGTVTDNIKTGSIEWHVKNQRLINANFTIGSEFDAVIEKNPVAPGNMKMHRRATRTLSIKPEPQANAKPAEPQKPADNPK